MSSARKVSLAALQFSCLPDRARNLATAEHLIRVAAAQGANVLLLPELFEGPYFCAAQKADFLELAKPIEGHPTIEYFRPLARQLAVVIAVSVFERAGPVRFNSLVLIDATGDIAGRYRKSHIPQAPGYEEKYYFSPGDSGFVPFKTRFGRVGIGICWDQWFPETARALVLAGADFLLYPTAIGSEPHDAALDSMEHWRIVMRGHAGANMVPVVAANRTGTENVGPAMSFYGSSFIADHLGALQASAGREGESVLVHEFDIEAIRAYRESWGCFRDRRPDLYGSLLSLDGKNPAARLS